MFWREKIRRIRFDLKSKIILFFVAFTLGMCAVIIVYMSDQYNRIILENIDENNKKMVESIDYYFEDVKTPMVMIARSSVVQTAMKNYNDLDTAQQVDVLNGLDDLVKNIAAFKEFISDIIIIGSDGYSYNIYNSDTSKYLKDYDFLNSEYLEEAQNGDIRLYYLGEHETDYYVHPEEWTRVYSVVLPVKQNSRIIGYIMCDIHADVINEIIQQNQKNSQVTLAVLDESKTLIYEQSADGAAGDEMNWPQRISRETTAPSHDLLKILFSDEDYVTWEQSDVTDWIYLYAETYSSFNEFVKKIIILGAVALLIGIGVILLFLRQLSGEVLTPLKNIAVMIHEMKINQGTETELGYRSSGKSIGELSIEIEKMIRRIDTLVNEVYVSELKVKDAQIQVMASQLSPHFLHNTLQLIEYQSQKNRPDNVTRIIGGLSYILRYSINSVGSEAKIKDEAAYAEAYLEIYRLRQQGQLSYDIFLEPEVEECVVPKMMLQPLVENCIRHGFAGRKEDSKIRISIYGQDYILYVEVWDNGNGIKEEEIRKLKDRFRYPKVVSEHIGLNNINSIIKIKYGEEYGVALESEEGRYTMVRIRLPMIRGQDGEQR